jgi:hypothetical protein
MTDHGLGLAADQKQSRKRRMCANTDYWCSCAGVGVQNIEADGDTAHVVGLGTGLNCMDKSAM